MHDKLTIQERIRDLRQEKKLTLEQLSEQTGLSKFALGSYESNDTKDIFHYAIIKLAKFYGVTTDYLLGISEQKTVGGTSHIYQLKQSRKRKARKSQRMGSEKTKRQKKRAGLQQTKHGIAKECSPKKNA